MDVQAQITDPRMLGLYEYWHRRRGGRRMPARRDIDPVEIPHQLPNLMLVDVEHSPLRFRYRLVGTRVVSFSGEDRTGRYFNLTQFIEKNPVILEQYQRTVDTGEPLFSLEPFTNLINGNSYEVERLLLPMSSDGMNVDMILVYFNFRGGYGA